MWRLCESYEVIVVAKSIITIIIEFGTAGHPLCPKICQKTIIFVYFSEMRSEEEFRRNIEDFSVVSKGSGNRGAVAEA